MYYTLVAFSLTLFNYAIMHVISAWTCPLAMQYSRLHACYGSIRLTSSMHVHLALMTTLHKFARHVQNCVEHQHCISGKGGGIAALNVYTTEEHRRYK
jgi:hypothetical protein